MTGLCARAISGTTARLMGFYREVLALIGQAKRDEAVELVRLKSGKTIMDEARTLIEALNQRELALLNERQHAASFWESFLVGAGSSALVLAKTAVI